MAAPLIVLLHGVNADGENLSPLRDFLRERLPGTVVVAPDAPFETPIGFQWFSLDGVPPASRGPRVFLARFPFDELLKSILDTHGADDLRRVALFGFSQGGMMALDALVTGRWPVAAVAGFSTQLASPPPFPKPARAPVLLVHGDDDSVIPSDEAIKAQATLCELGLAVDTHILPGVDHCITPEGMELAAEFFARSLPIAMV